MINYYTQHKVAPSTADTVRHCYIEHMVASSTADTDKLLHKTHSGLLYSTTVRHCYTEHIVDTARHCYTEHMVASSTADTVRHCYTDHMADRIYHIRLSCFQIDALHRNYRKLSVGVFLLFQIYMFVLSVHILPC